MATTDFTNGVTLTEAAWFDDVDTATYSHLTSVSGTNTITATGPVSCGAYAAGQRFEFIPANNNSGATTINISCNSVALGAKSIFLNGAACTGGEIKQNVPCTIVYDGTQFNIASIGGSLGAATATSLSTSTPLNSITAGVGQYKSGSWTPTASGLTQTGGSATLVGTYRRIGDWVVHTLKITPVTNTSSVISSTSFTGFPYACAEASPVVMATDSGFNGGAVYVGQGQITVSGPMYTPTWTNNTGVISVMFAFRTTDNF